LASPTLSTGEVSELSDLLQRPAPSRGEVIAVNE
jgi:hypothetical protein